MNTQFKNPYDDEDLIYDKKNKRYVLTEYFVKSKGIDLTLELDTSSLTDPSQAPKLALDRISFLVYSNIYSFGRNKQKKEFILACNPNMRETIRDAMLERLNYMIQSGDLSKKSGALISQGVRISTQDLIPSPIEKQILLSSGILHRGEFYVRYKMEDFDY